VTDVRIRPAQPGDENDIVAMVRELAEFERAADLAIATASDFHSALFGVNPSVFSLIAEVSGDASPNGTVIGFALWFKNFSTWRGKHGIYLEDLYVRPEYRAHGVGQALLAELAGICVAQGFPRLEWWVLDWNESARNFYHRQGAAALTEWIPYRVTEPELSQLAAKAIPK
jgi:GNAT superfamily N-acetyltransferase